MKYYIQMASVILPHLKDRPMVFTRYPDGIYGKAFYQKNVPDYAPEWLKTFKIKSDEGNITEYVIINDVKSLVWAANQACLELHPWLSKTSSLGNPDYVIFDLDPMENTDFEDARKVALALKELLDMEGLVSFAKTSGSTGIQIYVPIDCKYTYQQVRNFAKLFCQVIERTFPDITTTERSVSKREGKMYLDYMQNVKGKTIVAPYSPRPKKGAPVSCPITWTELEQGVTADMFTIKNMPERVKEKGDIFEGVLTVKQNIDKWVNI
ncbi:non-homologous end-joining DNA ligase [Tepidanaerobacter sp. GT38]|uniref:non-homologous end-joining DNA ligase n=1 Tax=Tepidanaerobacter sp. GT38 TaxID=2722793 RepID=UPI00351CF5ED